MARHSTKRPRELALEVIKLNKAVTPSEIDKHVGGEYSSKYICQLRKRGFEFEVAKDGRNVVSYTLVKEPKNAEEIRNGTKKQKAFKVAKVKATTKSAKTVAVKAPVKKVLPAPKKVDVKVNNLAKIKEVAEKRKALPPTPAVSSVAVDADFDEVTDVRSLI